MDILKLIGLIVVVYIIIKLLQKFLRKRPILSPRLRAKSDWKLDKLIKNFKSKYRRNPTKGELFRIIINASHITIRKRGVKGHWLRQRIRKYLLEKHNVVKSYRTR